jgi:aminopeptidase N
LAARPTEQAKADAWAQTVESDELPNALLRATVDGFHQPEHRELVRPYVGRYLEAIPSLWAERTTDTAKTIIVRLFPRLLADAEIADTIRSWLNDAELPPAPHRLIVEGLADMERALRAQARDRTAGQAARRH